jgi:nucleotidyltransferase/DNA polymerase involved in DNA repair
MVSPVKIACVLITHLPMKVELRRNPDLRDKPVIIVAQDAEVLDASVDAGGVSVGMPVHEAVSRCKSAVLLEADDMYYQRVFDEIIETLHNKSPFIEKADIGCAFLDMSGSEGIYGGDDGIVAALLNAVPRNMNPRVGLAKSKFPAYIGAIKSGADRASRVPDDVASYLRDLSIEMLPLSWHSHERLHGFALHTLGQVADLSIGSMQAQFGADGRVAWELANGIDKSPFTPSKHLDSVSDSLTFPVPATSLFSILPAFEILLGRIFSHPSIRGRYLRSVSVQSSILNRSPWTKKIVFKTPVNRKEAALFVLKNTIEAMELPGPLEDIRMTVFETAGESGMQSSLFSEVRKQQQLRETIRQLTARLRAKPPIYKVVDIEPWSRVPERRQSLVEYVP